MNKYRVWCEEDNCWEKDNCFLDPHGNLYQMKRSRLILSNRRHIIEFSYGQQDEMGFDIFKGDIVDFSILLRGESITSILAPCAIRCHCMV